MSQISLLTSGRRLILGGRRFIAQSAATSFGADFAGYCAVPNAGQRNATFRSSPAQSAASSILQVSSAPRIDHVQTGQNSSAGPTKTTLCSLAFVSGIAESMSIMAGSKIPQECHCVPFSKLQFALS
nr:hypothetical protein [Escherichia coli O25b:H4-ST131]